MEGLGTYFDQTLVHYVLYQQEVSHHGEVRWCPFAVAGRSMSGLGGIELLLPMSRFMMGSRRKQKPWLGIGTRCPACWQGNPLIPHLQASAGGLAPSRLYGAEHLLRLLVKLPELMPVCHMGPQVLWSGPDAHWGTLQPRSSRVHAQEPPRSGAWLPSP